jgi:hypothetical protein
MLAALHRLISSRLVRLCRKGKSKRKRTMQSNLGSANAQPSTISQWQQQVESQLVSIEAQLKMSRMKQDTLREHSNMLEGSLSTLLKLKPVLEATRTQE